MKCKIPFFATGAMVFAYLSIISLNNASDYQANGRTELGLWL